MSLASREERLDSLFRAYREACQAPEPSPHFMPQLWQKIEARQHASFWFGRFAKGFVTAAAAISMIMAALLIVPRWRNPQVYKATYLEVLAAHHVNETIDYPEARRSELPAESDLL